MPRLEGLLQWWNHSSGPFSYSIVDRVHRRLLTQSFMVGLNSVIFWNKSMVIIDRLPRRRH